MCAKAAAEVGLWEIWLFNKTVVDKTKTDAVRFGLKKDREKMTLESWCLEKHMTDFYF